MLARDPNDEGPTTLPALVLCLGLTSAALFLVLQLLDAVGPDPQRFFWLRVIVKPVPALALAALTLSAGGAARLVGAGLLLSACGDVLLELPGGFLPGLGSFLLGHLMYVAAFVRLAPGLHPALVLPFAGYAVVLMTVLDPHLGSMRVPVLAYAIVLSLMAWRAAARMPLAPRGRLRPLAGLLGAVFFMCSDTLIAIGRFVAPFTGERPSIMVTYWLAQVLIAISVVPARRNNGT
jgi:uncharacterized membrane protein YhhN